MYWKVECKRSLLFLASVWIGWPWCVEKRKRSVCVCLIQCMASVDWSSHFAWLDSCKEAFAPSTMKYQEVFKQMSSNAPFAKSGGRRCKIPPNSDSWSPRPQSMSGLHWSPARCSEAGHYCHCGQRWICSRTCVHVWRASSFFILPLQWETHGVKIYNVQHSCQNLGFPFSAWVFALHRWFHALCRHVVNSVSDMVWFMLSLVDY